MTCIWTVHIDTEQLSTGFLRYLVIFFRMHTRNGLKFDMLIYREYLFNWLPFGHGLLIFLILAVFWLSEASQICGFHHFLENALDELAELILWYPKKWKRQISAYENYPWLPCSQTFLVLCYLLYFSYFSRNVLQTNALNLLHVDLLQPRRNKVSVGVWPLRCQGWWHAWHREKGVIWDKKGLTHLPLVPHICQWTE